MTIQSKQDRDRLRQKGSKHKKIALATIKAVTECEQGRAVSECFADLRRVVKEVRG